MMYLAIVLGASVILTAKLSCEASSSSKPNVSISADQFEIGTLFLEQINLYMSEVHYRSYRTVLSNISPSVVRNHIDRQCFELLNLTFSNPLKRRWTSKLLDSSGSIFDSGSFSGTYTSFGDFDSCLAIQDEQPTLSGQSSVKGKYCFVTLQLPRKAIHLFDYRESRFSNQTWNDSLINQWIETNVKYPISRAICIPSICEESFIKKIILKAFEPLQSLDLDVRFCQTKANNGKKSYEWTTAALVLSSSFAILLVLTILGTFADVWLVDHSKTKQSEQRFTSLVTCFSMVSNAQSLFSTERQISYQWIDGLRVILTLVVLFSHVSANQGVLQLGQLSPFAHFPEDYQRQSSSVVNKYIVNSTFAIKSYFMISGFLLSVNFFKKRHLPSLVNYLLTRWLRFTPSLIGYVSFTLVLGFLGSGPLFHANLIKPYTQPCLENLWTQLLYVNNWFSFRNTCGFQTWYVSADLQIYLLAYLVLYFLSRQKWLHAYTTSVAFIATSYFVSLIIFSLGTQGLPFFLAVIYPQLPIPEQGYFLYWTATYNHLEAYFLGVIVGILVGKRIVYQLPQFIIHMFWYCAWLTLLLLPHSFPWFLKPYASRSLLDLVDTHSNFDAFVMTTAHGLWLISLAWIFYSASTYYTSSIQSSLVLKFLSASFFAPFSRLCFCIYLVHVPLTWFNVHQSRFPQMRNEFGTIQFTALTLVNSLIAAVALHILFEAPFAKLTRLIMAKHDKQTPVKVNVFNVPDSTLKLPNSKL